jgi:hypothetical protein
LVFGSAFVLSLIPMLLWTLASPLASVPDEPTHFIRAAAVVRGEVITRALPSMPMEAEAIVPNYVAHTNAQTCFAFKPNVPAGCQRLVSGDPNAPTVTGQTADANNPAFYAIVGLPSLVLSGNAALYAMRGVSAVLCALMIAFTFMAVSQLRRARWAYFAAFVSTTPMVLYLGGSVNPNGLEATAAGALFAMLALTFSTYSHGRRLIERLGAIALSTGLLVSTRNISLLWVLLALVAALLLSRANIMRRLARNPLVWVTVATVMVICFLALLWFIRPPVTQPQPALPGAGTAFIIAFVSMLVATFNYGIGWVGFFGWVDTPAPNITFVAWSAGMVGIAIAAFAIGRGTKRWALILLLAALFLTPAFAQASIVAKAGYIWQGRYTLAIVVMLVLACGFVLDRFGRSAPNPVLRMSVAILIGFLGIGQIAAFVMTLKRYVIGANASIQLMFTGQSWIPPLGWPTLALAFTAVTAVACVVIFRVAFSPEHSRRTNHNSPLEERLASS